jgi:hypothetical protein
MDTDEDFIGVHHNPSVAAWTFSTCPGRLIRVTVRYLKALLEA